MGPEILYTNGAEEGIKVSVATLPPASVVYKILSPIWADVPICSDFLVFLSLPHLKKYYDNPSRAHSSSFSRGQGLKQSQVNKGFFEKLHNVKNRGNFNRYTKRPLQDSAEFFSTPGMGESAFYCANHSVSCKCQQSPGWKIHRFFRWKMPFAVFRSGSGVSEKTQMLSPAPAHYVCE